jgi:hypothetical protein
MIAEKHISFIKTAAKRGCKFKFTSDIYKRKKKKKNLDKNDFLFVVYENI